jgi:hypothetical protein
MIGTPNSAKNSFNFLLLVPSNHYSKAMANSSYVTDSKRMIAVCAITGQNNIAFAQNINSMLQCRTIYMKPYAQGFLYGLHLSKSKSQFNLDKIISQLDIMLMKFTESRTSRFLIIGNELSGKAKTFHRGEHKFDPHFQELFYMKNPGSGAKLQPHADVLEWSLPLAYTGSR